MKFPFFSYSFADFKQMKFVKEISLFAKKQHQFQRQIIGDEESKRDGDREN